MLKDRIILAHGEGGKATQRLIREVFAPLLGNPVLNRMEDAAVLEVDGRKIALTTDAFVVEPPIFPGGDIGKLAVSGTVNDLAASGARPLWLAAAFLLEEGFPVSTLEQITKSFSRALESVGAQMVTADTKVVPRGHGGGIYIAVSGVGEVILDVSPRKIRPGDEIVISGDIARHSAAILAAREQIETDPPLESDCAPLWELVKLAVENNLELHAMRDPTRGGLATVCVEIAETAGVGIELREEKIPIRPQVAKLCDIYGFDPLYLANEGKMVFFVAAGEGERLVDILRQHPLGREAAVIGRVIEGSGVLLHTRAGGTRKLIMLEGAQLPRIC